MKRKSEISTEFIENCSKKFHSDPVNIVARNAVNSVGSLFSTVNADKVNRLSHIFMNTLKKKNVKATNQGMSGRCWMFAGLNIFRNVLMHTLDLDEFEFSEVYLFFWDKFERANTYMNWFVENSDVPLSDRAYEYMTTDYMNDGGWWNTFTNLVTKYGIVPKTSMKETWQSDDSEDMNHIIKEQLDSAVSFMKGKSAEVKLEIKNETLHRIYSTLVKFLGEPPKTFTWSAEFEEKSVIFAELTPRQFLDITLPAMDISEEFIVLSHVPEPSELKMYQNYKVRYTNNVAEGKNCILFNVPMKEMIKYTMKSIESGLAVWFAGDVKQSFNWLHSSLDNELDSHNLIFPQPFTFGKGERILMRNVQGNHAMAICGFNTDKKGRPTNWQVENSWGYVDNETPGLDGFLQMSHEWFEQYVTQIVICKKILSRSFLKKTKVEPIELNPWECMAPAIGGWSPPRNYLKILGSNLRLKNEI